MTLRNTMASFVDLTIDNKGQSLSKNADSKESFTKFTMEKVSLKDSKQDNLINEKFFDFIPSDSVRILEHHKPFYQTFEDNLFAVEKS
jgi:hypothetical protein